jgi:hypothetical protein
MYQLLYARTLGMLAVIVGLVFAGGARADDDDISVKKWRDGEKIYVEKVGEAVVKAAHPTARKKELLKYEFTTPKPNRTELVIKMEYHGAVTGKTYVADITVKIDTSNKDAWEVVNIDYTDNNTIGANVKKVQELIKKLNK